MSNDDCDLHDPWLVRAAPRVLREGIEFSFLKMRDQGKARRYRSARSYLTQDNVSTELRRAWNCLEHSLKPYPDAHFNEKHYIVIRTELLEPNLIPQHLAMIDMHQRAHQRWNSYGNPKNPFLPTMHMSPENADRYVGILFGEVEPSSKSTIRHGAVTFNKRQTFSGPKFYLSFLEQLLDTLATTGLLGEAMTAVLAISTFLEHNRGELQREFKISDDDFVSYQALTAWFGTWAAHYAGNRIVFERYRKSIEDLAKSGNWVANLALHVTQFYDAHRKAAQGDKSGLVNAKEAFDIFFSSRRGRFEETVPNLTSEIHLNRAQAGICLGNGIKDRSFDSKLNIGGLIEVSRQAKPNGPYEKCCDPLGLVAKADAHLNDNDIDAAEEAIMQAEVIIEAMPSGTLDFIKMRIIEIRGRIEYLKTGVAKNNYTRDALHIATRMRSIEDSIRICTELTK